MGAWMTPEGGIAVQMMNKTGAESVKGTLVALSTAAENAVRICPADIPAPIGVVYNDGAADGDQVWVVISGIADILIEDGTAATVGYWVKVSDNDAGRVDITALYPEGGTITAIEDHMSEVGHCMQTVASGTDKLARCIIHFN